MQNNLTEFTCEISDYISASQIALTREVSHAITRYARHFPIGCVKTQLELGDFSMHKILTCVWLSEPYCC